MHPWDTHNLAFLGELGSEMLGNGKHQMRVLVHMSTSISASVSAFTPNFCSEKQQESLFAQVLNRLRSPISTRDHSRQDTTSP